MLWVILKDGDTMETIKLAAAREIADKYGVKSEVKMVSLEKRLKQLKSSIASIKQDLSEDQLKLKRVSDLIAVYKKMLRATTLIILLGSRGSVIKLSIMRSWLSN